MTNDEYCAAWAALWGLVKHLCSEDAGYAERQQCWDLASDLLNKLYIDTK